MISLLINYLAECILVAIKAGIGGFIIAISILSVLATYYLLISKRDSGWYSPDIEDETEDEKGSAV